jgi:CMP-N,N'-diacetyllegionaminic acid synthase
MIAYTIVSAIRSQLFSKIIVATDDPVTARIAQHYGVTDLFMRSSSISGPTSIDFEWISAIWDLGWLDSEYFTILRPTSPLRSISLISQGFRNLLESKADSIRTVKKVKEHPGKMWSILESGLMEPVMPQPMDGPATHAMQYQGLPTTYVQTSVLEIARTSVIPETSSREGTRIIPLETFDQQNHAVDTEEDWDELLRLIALNPNSLIGIDVDPFDFIRR